MANEVIDGIKKYGSGGLLLKMDFEKTYDSVEWSFLDMMMKKMKFDEKRMKWIMTCVFMISLFVLVNGAPFQKFNTMKGLRQGCPLLPFLFNMVAKALSFFFFSSSWSCFLESFQWI